MKKILITILFTLFLSCSITENVNLEECEISKKKTILPAGFTTPWVITEIEKKMNEFGYQSQRLDVLNESYLKTFYSYIMLELYKRTLEYTVIKEKKYPSISSNLNIKNIEKGDILLTVNRNPSLMALDNENTVHHALLCTIKPTSENDQVFITSDIGDEQTLQVKMVSLGYINSSDDTVIVLRLYKKNVETIEKVIDFAIKQIGKPYNTNFTNKWDVHSYYCSQLVWRSYYEAGIDIDSNSSSYNDYGLVLASDIYRSSELYIVDYSN